MARAAILALLLALAACGGSEPSDGDPRERFIAEANRICQEGEAKLAEVAGAEELRGAREPEAAAALLERATEAFEPYVARLRRVEAPAGVEGDWDAFLDSVQEAFDLFPRLAAATRSEDREELTALAARFREIAADSRPFAERYGLRECLPGN